MLNCTTSSLRKQDKIGKFYPASSRTFSTTRLNVSYGCAPDTRYLFSKMRAGTPFKPYSWASSTSADTSASKAGSFSAVSNCSTFKPTLLAISFKTFTSSMPRASCQYAFITDLWKDSPLPCDSAYLSAMRARRLSIPDGPECTSRPYCSRAICSKRGRVASIWASFWSEMGGEPAGRSSNERQWISTS